MKKIFILISFCSLASFSFSQSADSISTKGERKFMPAIKVGGDYTGFFTGEAGFFLGMTRKNLNEASKLTSTMCHGPAIACEIGKPGEDILFGPKFSYEYYSISYGGRISVIDYMNENSHNIYISPELGITGGGIFNIFAGANIPVSGGITEVSTLRVSLTLNLFSYLFKKDKPKN